jgi:isoleucyl-tRNA synthetase
MSEEASSNVLDQWIRSSLETLIQRVTAAMDGYELQGAVRPFVHFIEDLTNWYIRRSRRRFWKSRDDADKAMAYRTLNDVLLQLSRIAAPFVPFISESIHRNLRTDAMPESVHLCDFPRTDGRHRLPELEERMSRVMTVVKLGRALRAEHELKVRQPLAAAHVVSRDSAMLEAIRPLDDLILDELNVKRAEYGHHETELVTLSAKADFKRLGPRFGPKVKKIAQAISALSSECIESLLEGGSLRLPVDGADVALEPDDVVVARQPKPGLVVASEGMLVVALETQLTGDLVREGLAREFVNKIQSMRKSANLEVVQRIRLSCRADEAVRDAVERHADYVRGETLCVDCRFDLAPSSEATEWDINGHPCSVRLEPV